MRQSSHRLAAAIGAVAVLWGAAARADPCMAIPDRGPMPPWLHRGASFSGPVVYVGDGDSLCVDVGRALVGFAPKGASWVEVRLADFYAPELHESGGAAAKAALERMVHGRRVSCVADHRSYDRTVARCTMDGRGLGDRLRAAGDPEGGRAWPAARR